ncbi:MAG: aspartyl protease family protein [Dehalococcoidia bacterium]
MRGPLRELALSLFLDTGSLFTIVRPTILLRAGYDLSQPRSHIAIVTASGEDTAPLYVVDELAALGHRRQNLAVLAYRLPPSLQIDGLLGMNFLRGRRLTVDFRTGILDLE